MLPVSVSTALFEMFAERAECSPWMASAMLAFECCEVIGLRLTKLAAGDGAAGDEAVLMVSEKFDAMFETAASLMAGASAADIVERYREHVAANARRLSEI